MATYTTHTQGVSWAANKNMYALVNHTGSGQIVDVYRIWMPTIQTSTVTGGTCLVELWQCTSVASFTAGTAQTFVKHDTNSGAVNANVIANSGTSTVLTKNTKIANYTRYTEEFAVSDAAMEAFSTYFYPVTFIWDIGYGDSNIQPIRLREGEGIVLYTPSTGGGTYVGSVDITVEMNIY